MTTLIVIGAIVVFAIVCAACSESEKSSPAVDVIFVGSRRNESSGGLATFFGILIFGAFGLAALYAAFLVLSVIWPYLLGLVGLVVAFALFCHFASKD